MGFIRENKEKFSNSTKMPKKAAGENSKKAAGNARKADNANKKKQADLDKQEADEATKWEQGAKKANKKKEDAQQKKEEAARKKAEKDAQAKEEEESMPSKGLSKLRGAEKVASRRAGKIDDFLDFNSEKPQLSATGVDDALEALSLTGKGGGVQNKELDRHPERRVKAAFAAYEERRLPEIREENPGLRLQQIKNLVYKEFQKSPENPMNQDTNVKYNASKEELEQTKQAVKSKKESKFS